MRNPRLPSLDQTVSDKPKVFSSWFIMILAVGALFYFQAIQEKKQSFQEMTVQLQLLEKEVQDARAMHEELLLQIQSQVDPAWVEMVLKRNLGMVREGQKKVYFQAQ